MCGLCCSGFDCILSAYIFLKLWYLRLGAEHQIRFGNGRLDGIITNFFLNNTFLLIHITAAVLIFKNDNKSLTHIEFVIYYNS